MEIKEMTIEQLEERKEAIVAELDAPEADLDALEEEARAIREEIESRKAEEAKRNEIRASVASGAGIVTEKIKEEETKKMTNEEIRASKEYVDAYANYIKSGDDKECRALLTETVSGTVPVPVMVDGIVRTAWENDPILSRLRKTYFRGNLKVAFERSATAAAIHTEGTSAPTEESLVLGIVTMIPSNIKKWIRISDEAVATGGEAFLRYIYDELTYQIVKKISEEVVKGIARASTTHSATAVGVPAVSAAPALGTVAEALGNLSGEATNPVVIMNRLTWALFKKAQYAGNFAVDPFEGLTVPYSDGLPAYATASTSAVYMMVGDLDGVQANFPEGENVVIKWDDLSEAESDLVKVVGREYVAYALTAPGRFCNITKPAPATT